MEGLSAYRSRSPYRVTISQILPVEIIDQSAQLASAVQAMATSRAIAVDTESNSFHHYPEQLCLIQIATRDRAYIIDTIAVKEIDALEGILGDSSVMKVIHGADYDLRSLDRHCGFRVRGLYDTSVAARFVGITRFGLADLIKELLSVSIQKSKRLQLTDWGRRPLPSEALDYAVSDITSLLALHGILSERVRNLGRTAWVAEECARLEEVRYIEPNFETAFLSMKGARDLDERGLAILQSLFTFRESEARLQHRPPFFIIPDAALVFIAGNPTARLEDIPGLGQSGLQRYGRGIQQAIRDGMAAPPATRPAAAFEYPSREEIERLRSLKTWRTLQGTKLSLDPSLVWPATSLARLAKGLSSLDIEIRSKDVRVWQSEQSAKSLKSYLESLPRRIHNC